MNLEVVSKDPIDGWAFNEIQMAESLIFFKKYAKPEHIIVASEFVQLYMELRLYIRRLGDTKFMSPVLIENGPLVRLLFRIDKKVKECQEAFVWAQQLANVAHVKQSGWLTRHLIETQVREMQSLMRMATHESLGASMLNMKI
eukprot:Platyproteum_vivax@DN1126_c0_g1_i1.p1